MKKVAVIIHSAAAERRGLVELLSGLDLQVLDFADAAQALDHLMKDDPVHLIVTDLQLPKIDGWQLCRLLRSPEFPQLNRVPLLVTSATFSGADIEAITLDLGANAFLSWPGDPRLVREVAAALLQGQNPLQPQRALLVEDDPETLKLLRRIFTARGYTCAGAANGAEARACFLRDAPDLAVVDYHLPDVAGEDLIAEFSAAGGHTAVVVVTGDSDPRVAIRILGAGANGYVRKPFDPARLALLCQQVRRERAVMRTEELLEQRTRQLRLTQFAVEYAADAVFWIEPDGRFSYVNEAACRLLGYSRSQLLARHVYDIDPLFSRELWAEHWQRLREAGCLLFESQHRAAAGRIFPVEINANFLLFEGHEYDFAFVRDITARQQMERDLLTAEKMESIGRLAGGIAHDFNNVLQTILGYSDILIDGLDAADPRRSDLQEIKKAASRAALLTSQLLAYGQKQMMAPCILDLNELLEHLREPLRNLLGPQIALYLQLEPRLSRIKADPVQLEQVIKTMAVNARDAMSQDGQFTISTANFVLQPADASIISDGRQGQFVRLAVSDTGRGMSHEVQQHIFEPFFSTKGLGKGTGMDLAMAYGVIKQHDGWINVYSEVGQGTTFKTYLPAFSALPPAESDPAPVMAAADARRPRKILLVEDEPAIVHFAARVLRQHGYEVCTAMNAAEAQQLFERASDSVALLFCDIILPDQSGLVLAGQCRARQPGLKVLLTSGYTDDKTRWPEIDRNGYRFIPKPYPSTQLLAVVQSLLG